MKANIHPTYYPQAQVSCTCGNTFTTGSTKPAIRTDVCSKCHPFFTGQQKLVDTLGRVERFQKSQERALQTKATAKPKKDRVVEEKRPMTLREMLLTEQKTSA